MPEFPNRIPRHSPAHSHRRNPRPWQRCRIVFVGGVFRPSRDTGPVPIPEFPQLAHLVIAQPSHGSKIAGSCVSSGMVSSSCACLLPSCPTCGGGGQRRFAKKRQQRTGSGRHLSTELMDLVATVHSQLQDLLRSQKYLKHGPDFRFLKRDLSTTKVIASRHEWLVAHVCQVGIRSVQNSCRRKARSAIASAKRRGPKPAEKPEQPPEPPSHDAGLEESLEDAGSDRLHGVRGRYLVASKGNAEAHATALVLGRLYLTANARSLPERALPTLLAMMHQAGAPVGQMQHHHSCARFFACVLPDALGEGAARLLGWPSESSVPHLCGGSCSMV